MTGNPRWGRAVAAVVLSVLMVTSVFAGSAMAGGIDAGQTRIDDGSAGTHTVADGGGVTAPPAIGSPSGTTVPATDGNGTDANGTDESEASTDSTTDGNVTDTGTDSATDGPENGTDEAGDGTEVSTAGTDGGSVSTAAMTGQTLRLDGRSYASIPDSNAIDLDTTGTFEFWFKFNETSDEDAIILRRQDGYTLRLQGTGEERGLAFDVRGGGGFVSSDGGVVAGRWTHVALVHDGPGNSMSLYINGESAGSSGDNGRDLSSGFGINVGTNADANGDFFVGEIDNLRIWDSTRGLFDVQDNRFRELSGSENGLVALYQFDGASGSTAPSLAGDDTMTLTRAELTDHDVLPVAPDLHAVPRGDGIQLSWDERVAQNGDNDHSSFTIYRSTLRNPSNRQQIATVSASSASGQTYLDTSIAGQESKYIYELTATNSSSGQEGDYSKPAPALMYDNLSSNSLEPASVGGGESLTLDGRGYGTIGDGPSYAFDNDGNEAMSVEFWLRYNRTSDADAYVLAKQDHFWVQLQGEGDERRITLFQSGGGGDITSDSGIPAGRWTHVAITSTQSSQSIYINGELDRTQSGRDIRPSNQPLRIGTNGPANDNFLVGQIDDLRLWDDERSASEVQAGYADNLVGDESDLIANFRFPGEVSVSGTDRTYGASTRHASIALENTARVDDGGAHPVSPDAHVANGNGSATVSWAARDPDASSVRIYRSPSPEATPTLVADGLATTGQYTDTNVSNDRSYDYEVTSIDGDGQESDFSRVSPARPFANGGGGSLHFDGSASATVSDRPSLDLDVDTEELTFEFWLRFNRSTERGAYVLDKDNAYYVRLLGGGEERRLGFDMAGGGGYIESNEGIPAGRWTHVALTNSPSGQSIYINGQLDSSGSGLDIRPSGEPLKIGSNGAGNDDYLTGRIDGLRVWSDVRTDTEIQSSYTTELVGNESDLEHYWTFDAPSGSPAVPPAPGGLEQTLSVEERHASMELEAGTETRPNGSLPVTPDLHVANGNGSATVTWAARADATESVRLYRSSTRGAAATRTRVATGLNASGQYTDTNLTNGQTYYYEATAVDGGARESDVSSFATAAPYRTAGGGSLLLDGSSHGNVSHRGSLDLNHNGNNELTIEAWVKHDGTSDTDAYILNKPNAYNLRFIGAGEDRPVSFDLDGGGGFIRSNSAIPADVWTHVTVVNTGSTLSLYINGELDAQANGLDIRPSSRPLQIGSNGAGNGAFFSGRIDEVAIWNDARTDAEIADSYARPLVGNESNLKHYWQFDASTTDRSRGTEEKHSTVFLEDAAETSAPGVFPLPPRSYARGDEGQTEVAWKVRNQDTTSDVTVYRANQSDLRDRGEIATVNASRSFSHTDTNLTNGVVSYYQTTAVDADGQESDYSARAHARPSTNPLGVAFEHTNNASFGRISPRSSINFRDEMTMEAWINFDADSANPAVVLFRENGYYMELQGTGATRTIEVDVQNGGGGFLSHDGLSAGQWYHVAATNDGSQKTLYVNGEQVAQGGVGRPGYGQDNPSQPVGIGANAAGTDFWFNGEIDEVRLWDTARSSAQIDAAYDRELTGYERGLVGYWRGCDVPSDTSAARGSARKPMTQSLTSVDCVANTNADAQTGGGQTTTATVRLDGAPDALRGYRVRLNATNGVIIDSVDPVLITGRQFTVQDGGAGTPELTAAGVNLTGANNFTDNRTLFRATFAGNVTRSDLETQVLDLLDGTGNDMDPNRVSVTLSQGTPGAGGSPFDQPLGGGEAPPADADGDGKAEDIDGNGEFNFVDVITLVFALSSLTDLSQAQTAALDFSGDDAVDFVDVITLVFEL